MSLNNHNNLSWAPLYRILSLPVERDEELVTQILERISPELLAPSHMLQFLNSTSLQVSSLSNSPGTTVSIPQGVPDWHVQQFKQLATGIPLSSLLWKLHTLTTFWKAQCPISYKCLILSQGEVQSYDIPWRPAQVNFSFMPRLQTHNPLQVGWAGGVCQSARESLCLYNRCQCTRPPPFAHQSLREFSSYCFFVLLEIISSQKETLLCLD